MPNPKLMSLAGAELAVGADAEGNGVGLFLDDVGVSDRSTSKVPAPWMPEDSLHGEVRAMSRQNGSTRARTNSVVICLHSVSAATRSWSEAGRSEWRQAASRHRRSVVAGAGWLLKSSN